MSNQLLKVRRDAIVACMTCPLCSKLLREATTISECLHTFCRKCIYKKLSDEEWECCPICQIDLGCSPLEKLRPDHNLQDVRAKIFPYKRLKVKARAVLPSVTLPARRKERSLSSLVVSTPRVSTQSGMTGRRSKSIARKSLHGSRFPVEKHVKKDENSAEDHPRRSSSPESLNKSTQNLRQSSLTPEPSSHSLPMKESNNGSEPWEDKADPWDPLNCLVEAANRSKSSKILLQGSSTAKSEPLLNSEKEGHVQKKFKHHGLQKPKVQQRITKDDANLESRRPRKLGKVRQKKALPAFGEFNVSPQAVLDCVSARHEKRNHPIWFSLVASNEPNGDTSLPQISASYLRIKDGNATISFIQKYLMRKLDLSSEHEVEIRCMGQSLIPTLTMNELVELWIQYTPADQVSAIIGSSAKNFVMVLVYGRKIRSSS